jgi:Xaa-Pro aminopeptidase
MGINRKVSRRRLLGAAAAAGVGVPLLSQLSDAGAGAEVLSRSGAPRAPVPSFSLAERDRRWAAVRSIMAQPQWNLDVIIADPCRLGSAPSVAGTVSQEGFTRYLTQVGGLGDSEAGVIFPRDPSAPVLVLLDGNTSFWQPLLSEWTSDGKLVVTTGGGTENPPDIIGPLQQMGATRVGNAGLQGTKFNAWGLMPAPYLDAITAALPGVDFLPIERWKVNPPDPGPLAGPAMAKSPEEQEAVRACVRATERAIEVIVKAAGPPASVQANVWYPAFFSMFQETGEEPERLSISLDAHAAFTAGQPTNDPLHEGQIINQEMSAKVQGYGAQVNHGIFVGSTSTPGYAYYETAANVAIQAIKDGIGFVNQNPGSTTGDLIAAVVDSAVRQGAEPPSGVLIHGDGVGNLSRPRLGAAQLGSGQDDNVTLVPGMAFDLKPAIIMQRSVIQDVGAQNREVQVGENILITETGAIRLGTRKLVPLLTGS